MDIKNCDGLDLLNTLKNNSIDIVLTDPPYIISRASGMNTNYNKVKDNEKNNVDSENDLHQWLDFYL